MAHEPDTTKNHPTSYRTGTVMAGERDVLLGDQSQDANRRTKKSLYFQVAVIACAILFGVVCGNNNNNELSI